MSEWRSIANLVIAAVEKNIKQVKSVFAIKAVVCMNKDNSTVLTKNPLYAKHCVMQCNEKTMVVFYGFFKKTKQQ